MKTFEIFTPLAEGVGVVTIFLSKMVRMWFLSYIVPAKLRLRLSLATTCRSFVASLRFNILFLMDQVLVL